MRKAIVLLSGGLDSATVLAMTKAKGYETYAMSFSYGQRHNWELQCAKRVSVSLEAKEHRIVEIDLRSFGGSALTSDLAVPKNRTPEEMADGGVPVTYVPARNTVLLSFALAWSEVIGCRDIFIGVNALDFGGYPDCRPEFIAMFEQLANVATKGQGIRIHSPLISLTKADIISKGIELGIDYSLTSSCYDPSSTGGPCNACDACKLRTQGFNDNGLHDPLNKGGQ